MSFDREMMMMIMMMMVVVMMWPRPRLHVHGHPPRRHCLFETPVDYPPGLKVNRVNQWRST